MKLTNHTINLGFNIDPLSFNFHFTNLKGFNGEEMDDEVRGTKGASYNLGARMYDSRLGRMLSVDPWEKKYAWQSTYAYFSNNPIANIDWKGYGIETRVLSSSNVTSITNSFKSNDDCKSCGGTDMITMVEQQVVYVTNTITYPSGTVIKLTSTETITTVTSFEIDNKSQVSNVYQQTSTKTIKDQDPTRAPSYKTNSSVGYGTIDLEKGIESESISQDAKNLASFLQDYKTKNKKSPVEKKAADRKEINEDIAGIKSTQKTIGSTAGVAGTLKGNPGGGVMAAMLWFDSFKYNAFIKEDNPDKITLKYEGKDLDAVLKQIEPKK